MLRFIISIKGMKLHRTEIILTIIFIFILTIGIIMEFKKNQLLPPLANKIPKKISIHGDQLVDNYFWMNERDTQPVLDYLHSENDYTYAKMKHTEHLQNTLYKEMRSRIKEDDTTVPYKFGNYEYFTKTENGKQYDIYCRQLASEDIEITLDLNDFAEDHDYLVMNAYKVSPNEKMLAFTLDTSGSELHKMIVKEIQSGQILDDYLLNIDGSIEWANDNKTIFYIRLDAARRPYQLWRHTIGESQDKDILVYQEDDEKYYLGLHRTKNGKYLKMSLESNITTEIRILDRNNPLGNWMIIADRDDGVENSIYHHGDYFYILTNKDAVNFKLIRKKIGQIDFEDFIDHSENIYLKNVTMFKNHLAVLERENGQLQIRIYEFLTDQWDTLTMDDEIYSIEFDANYDWDSPFLRFSYGSFLTPYSVYDYDFRTKRRVLRKQEEVLAGYDPNNYISERIWANSDDGKQIAITILYKKDIQLEGNNPCFLWGYGSYGATYDPWFSSNIFSLVDRGFVYARAHIRGSSFLGRQWYEDGKMLNKKNTFKDFITVAEYLIEKNITSSKKLAIYGGSAGGLLIGAVVNTAPDLFQVAIPSVPFVDVINTMLDTSIPLTATEFDEWGNPAQKEYYDYMLSYSPYENIESKEYPHILVLAGYNDPRVQYWEPAKWTAKLRSLKTDDNDLLLKTIMDAGHFSSSGRFDYLKDVAFYYAFILDKLGIRS